MKPYIKVYDKNVIKIASFYFYITVLPNYNFIFTCVHTRGAMQYFTCQMPKFPMEIQISTRRDVALRRGMWHLQAMES